MSNKGFFITVSTKPKISTIQTRFAKNRTKYALWSCQRWKFGEITWPISHFNSSLYFIEQRFSAFHRLFCKTANLGRIDLKLSGSLSDVNINNPLVKLACLEVAFPKICFFRIVICNLQTRQVNSKEIFTFVPSYLSQHLEKIS